jgi:TonB-dependent starch-binding outer membrane protein SusC
MMLKILVTLIFVLSTGGTLEAQQSVTGRVLSNPDQQYLPNATIISRQNKTSATTNENGSFSIRLSRFPDTLIVSYVGYRAQKVYLSQPVPALTITLEPSVSTLDQVLVNTGYQKMKPNEINGSVMVIDNKKLNQQTGMNILDRLKNVTSGVSFNDGFGNGNPENKTNISVRGLSTINGPLDPLIVLDNFIYEGNIANINPADIESITILKDAAAASIWGARAGNGVIVITTKKGKLRQKPKVQFSTTFISSEKPDITSVPDMSTADYIDMEQFLFNKGYFNATIRRPYRPLPPAVEVFLEKSKGLISAADSAQQINTLNGINTRDQYSRYFYQPAFTGQYALNVSGGSQNLAWLVAGSYNKNIDNLNASYQKMNFRFSNTYKATKNLQLNLEVYYTASKSLNGKSGFNNVSSIGGRYVSYMEYADEKGNPLPVESAYNTHYIDTAGGGKLLDWNYYPLSDYKHNKSTTSLDEIVANIGLDYQVFKSLDFSLKYQYEQQRTNVQYNADIESYNTRNLINLYSQLNRSTGIINYIVPLGGILTVNNAALKSENVRGQLNFSRQWGQHSVTAMAGGEIREVLDNGNWDKYYGYNEDPLSYANVDLVNRYPTFVTGISATIPGGASLSSTANRFVSAYSNISYLYKQRYSVSGSARKDGSNILGVNTNEKWKPLWSAGLGWEVSKEPFYAVSWLPYLKLRATYGYSGNVDLSKSALPVAYYGNDGLTNLPVAVISTINNPDLKWEQSRQINVGINFSSNNNWLSGSADIYRKKGTDLYAQTPYDYTTWGMQNTIVKNVADMKGSGVDVVLNVKIIDQIFKWQASALYNFNTSKTTAYFDDASRNLTSLFSTGKTINPVIGKPLYAIASYKWAGLDDQGNPQGFLQGKPSTDYQAIYNEALNNGLKEGNVIFIGSSIPTSFGSVINTFSWKKFEMAVNISYKLGYYFAKPSLSYSALVSNGRGNSDYEKRWQKAGDELTTNVPSFIYPVNSQRDGFYNSSQVNVLKGDNFRLQYLTFSYSFPEQKKLLFDQLRVFFNAANLGILWRANKEDIDPDYPGGIPPPASFSFGMNVNF